MTMIELLSSLSDGQYVQPLRRSEVNQLLDGGVPDGPGNEDWAEPPIYELLDGLLVAMDRKQRLNPEHAYPIQVLTRLLVESIVVSEGGVRPQLPLGISDISQPNPDLCVVPPLGAAYQADHPTTASLVIEVAVTSRRMDLVYKAQMYGAAGIPDYWVLDVNREAVVVHRNPHPLGYDTITTHVRGTVTALHHPRLIVPLSALYP